MRRLLFGLVGVGALAAFLRRRPHTVGALREHAPTAPPAIRKMTGRLPGRRTTEGMGGKDALETYLRESGVAYALQHHPVAYTAQEVAEAEHVSGNRVAKVVMVMRDGDPAMLVLPASRRVDFERVYDVLGTTAVRLAAESEFADLFPVRSWGRSRPSASALVCPSIWTRRWRRSPAWSAPRVPTPTR